MIKKRTMMIVAALFFFFLTVGIVALSLSVTTKSSATKTVNTVLKDLKCFGCNVSLE